MSTSAGAGESIRVRVSSRSSLVDSIQEITLRAALNRAIDLVADCFDNCNREAEPSSVFSQQAKRCDEDYAAFGNHKTTLTYTNNFAKSLVHSGLDHLKAATNAALDTGAVVRWSSLALTRSLIEASAECSWLVDAALDLDTRLRRTNQMLVRECHQMIRILPDAEETTPRLISVDPIAKATCLRVRDAALQWARAQGWQCRNGKTITRARWVGEMPGYRESVALASAGSPDYWNDVYSMLSGATHSQSSLMVLSLREDPGMFLERALMMLDIGVSFYTSTLKTYADFMGWDDHDIDNWFSPVHAAIEHLRFPEEVPLPVISMELDKCTVCPHYQDHELHRLALISHLCALFERNIDSSQTGRMDAPGQYFSAVEFLNDFQQAVTEGDHADPKIQEMRTALGTEHAGALTLFGSDLSDVLPSIAASWAVLRSPNYQSSVGTVQGWMSQPDDQSPAVPYGNR